VEVEGLDTYTVVLDSSTKLSKFEFVYFEEDGKKVLGYVEWIRVKPFLPSDVPWDVAAKMPLDGKTAVALARVRSLDEGTPSVGQWVYLASDEDVSALYEVPEERALWIGNLKNRPSVPIRLDMNALVRHLAIIAATGSGKTWTSVVLIEELLKKGATVLILDPHGEYVPIKEKVEELGGDALVLKAHADQEGDVLYKIDLTTVDTDELAFVMGIPKTATRIRAVLEGVRSAAQKAFKEGGDREALSLRRMVEYLNAVAEASEVSRSFNQFASLLKSRDFPIEEKAVKKLWSVVRKGPDPVYDLIKYVSELERLGVYDTRPTPLMSFLRPSTATVFNLSGIKKEVQVHLVYDVLKRIFEARVRYMREVPGEKYPFPVMVVVEEAHRFAPPPSEENVWTTSLLKRIASEGRKFGVLLTIITQRPSRVDQTVLSQCQSQIIMRIINPKDQEAVANSSEELGARLASDLPSLKPGEAIVVGPALPKPAFIKVRPKVLDYGGGDLDLVEEWGKATLIKERVRAVEELAPKVAELLGTSFTKDDIERAKGIIVTEKIYLSKVGNRVKARVGECSFVLGEGGCDPARALAAAVEAALRGYL